MNIEVISDMQFHSNMENSLYECTLSCLMDSYRFVFENNALHLDERLIVMFQMD